MEQSALYVRMKELLGRGALGQKRRGMRLILKLGLLAGKEKTSHYR